MTTIQLQKTVLQEVVDLMDNQEAMKKLQKFLASLKKEKAEKEELTAAEKEEILDDIREGLRELKLAREGKIKLQSAREFLHELRG